MKGALVTFIAKVEGVVNEKFSGAEPQTLTLLPTPSQENFLAAPLNHPKSADYIVLS